MACAYNCLSLYCFTCAVDVHCFLLPACRHGSKAGVTETYEGHQAPVTGIDTHKVQEGIDLSHLFLTSSFDWTIKLWNHKVRETLLTNYKSVVAISSYA